MGAWGPWAAPVRAPSGAHSSARDPGGGRGEGEGDPRGLGEGAEGEGRGGGGRRGEAGARGYLIAASNCLLPERNTVL